MSYYDDDDDYAFICECPNCGEMALVGLDDGWECAECGYFEDNGNF